MTEYHPMQSNLELNSSAPLALVIDDSNFMHIYMRNQLAEIGCNVICAYNGLEGVKLFEEYRPSLVFIDLQMPILDGFKTCELIRHMDKGREVTIYMITTTAEDEAVEKAFDIGFDDYLLKPLDPIFVTRLKKLVLERNCCRPAGMDLNIENFSKIKIELSEARALQNSLLPKPIKNYYVVANHVYSPYDQVSGDYIDYWWNEEEKRLYGYALDVTGHGIASAMQVFALRMLFCQGQKRGLPINEVLEYINSEIFKYNQRRSMSTAITFYIDMPRKELVYTSAGISPFYLTSKEDKNKRKSITTAGYPLGFKKNVKYGLKTLPIQDVSEILFATDGFTELLNCPDAVKEKNDDASAIIIKILR